MRSSGTPIDLRARDGRVLEQHLLDLAGVDVLAAADHHVLAAPDDVEVALGVHHAEVAGVHPAVVVDRRPPSRRRPPSSRASRGSRACRSRPAVAARHGLAGQRDRSPSLRRAAAAVPTVDDAAVEIVVAPRHERTRARSRSCRRRCRPRARACSLTARFITSTGHGAPAMTPVRSEVRSNSPNRGARAARCTSSARRRCSCTAPRRWPRVSPAARSSAPGRPSSRRSRAAEVADAHPEAVVQRHRDAHAVCVRVAEHRTPIAAALFKMLWCVSVAPLGLPVVPLVYWMLIGSSGSSAASRSARDRPLDVAAGGEQLGPDAVVGAAGTLGRRS